MSFSWLLCGTFKLYVIMFFFPFNCSFSALCSRMMDSVGLRTKHPLCFLLQARPTLYQVVKEMIDKMGYEVSLCFIWFLFRIMLFSLS